MSLENIDVSRNISHNMRPLKIFSLHTADSGSEVGTGELRFPKVIRRLLLCHCKLWAEGLMLIMGTPRKITQSVQEELQRRYSGTLV